MFSFLRGVWENVYGLVVDDGSLAVGALVSVAVAWAFATLAGATAETLGGGLLLVLVAGLILANLYVAGRNARRAS